MQAVRGRDAGRSLVSRHLMLLPAGTPERAVNDLVVALHRDAATHPGQGLRLGRHAALAGPMILDAGAAAVAAVPAPWSLAWALECPVEREGPPLPGLVDRDGLTRAFPGGLPVRAERRALDLVMGLARRLGGAVRVAGSGVVLQPDPQAWTEVTVLSEHWLEPAHAHAALARAVPGLELATGGAPWEGVGEEAMQELAALDSPLAPGERDLLHSAADARDDEALARPDELDAYALALLLDDPSSDGERDGGVVEVLVEEPEVVPVVLAEAAAAVAYRVRWWPPDEAAAEQEHPPPVYRAQREVAHAVVGALVAALVPLVDGIAVDAAGLPLR